MDSSAIVVITSTYPHGVGEDFVAAELPYLLAEFSRVIIAPLSTAGAPNTRELPVGVELLDWNNARSLRAAGTTARRLPTLLDHWKHFPRSVAWAAQANQQAAAMLPALQRLLGGHTPTVFYGYWLMRHAAIATALSHAWQAPSAAVARAHGTDVFPAAAPRGYLPGRRYLASTLDHVYPISAAGAKMLTQQGFATSQVHTCRLGVNAAEEIASAPLKTPWVIASCSSAAPVKQLPLMAASIAALIEAGHPVHWHHIGGTTTADFSLAETIAELGISESVTLHGLLPNSAVRPRLVEIGAHLLLNTSASEGVPVSIMEAFSVGIPTVATNVGGTGELVTPECGALIAAPTPTGVSDTITEVLQVSADSYARMRAGALQRWEQVANAETNYAAFAEHLAALL